MQKNNQKYTLLLPIAIYLELVEEAQKQDKSIKEVLIQCLKFGLTVFKIIRDPNAELFIREKVEIPDSGSPRKFEIKETKIILI